jgi:hypothetical protein
MGNEIFEEIKKKYEETKNFSYLQQDSFYVDKSFFEDMGKLIQIIETMNKRKLQDMTFEYFNDNELQSIVGQYLTDFLKEIIKRDYISKKKLYKHIEMLEKENCHETCEIKKLIDCGRQCSIGCTIKNIKKILEE